MDTRDSVILTSEYSSVRFTFKDAEAAKRALQISINYVNIGFFNMERPFLKQRTLNAARWPKNNFTLNTYALDTIRVFEITHIVTDSRGTKQ